MCPRTMRSKPPPEPEPKPNGDQLQVEEEKQPAQPARVEVKATGGSIESVRAALGPAKVEIEEVEPLLAPGEEPPDPVALALADGKNMIVVTRIYPRRWGQHKVDIKCERYQCPIGLDDLESDVFTRFGGKRFKVSIHPNTPTGEMKTLASFTIESDDDVPLDDGQRYAVEREIWDPRTMVAGGGDPTLVEDDSPNAVMRRALLDQIKRVTDKKQLAELRKQLREIEEEERAERREERREGQPASLDPKDKAIESMQRQLDEMKRQQNDERLARIEAKLDREPKGNDNTLLIELIRSADSKFATMMTALTAGSNKSSEDVIIDKIVKLKNLFGPNDSRVKGLEERLINVAFDKMLDGGLSDVDPDEDVAKYTIKQAVPLIKTYLEKKLEKDDKGTPMTEEKIRQIYAEAAQKAATDVAEKLVKEGKIQGIAHNPQPKPAPTQQKTQPAQPPPKEEGVKVAIPPGPQGQGYDRKKSIDFVISVALSDIAGGVKAMEQTFVIGDILDKLDDEFLTQLSGIDTGQQLEQLLAPHADPAKLEKLKEVGKNEDVSSWLRRVIVTTQDEFRKARKAAAEKK